MEQTTFACLCVQRQMQLIFYFLSSFKITPTRIRIQYGFVPKEPDLWCVRSLGAVTGVRSRSAQCYGWAIAPLGHVLCAIGNACAMQGNRAYVALE